MPTLSNSRFGPLHPGYLYPTTIELWNAPRKMIRNGETHKMQHYWENIPSIEVAAKIADTLCVTLDYLVKEGEYQQIDKTTLKGLKDIERLDPGTKTKVFDIIDTYLRDFKTRQAYMA
ncbi:hypothetical protein BA6E_102165 [Bacteroidales bacterium 6E]|nr:hypothetical protein BA6E_102165 [Bacteroidales bacterium 6E]